MEFDFEGVKKTMVHCKRFQISKATGFISSNNSLFYLGRELLLNSIGRKNTLSRDVWGEWNFLILLLRGSLEKHLSWNENLSLYRTWIAAGSGEKPIYRSESTNLYFTWRPITLLQSVFQYSLEHVVPIIIKTIIKKLL